MCQATGRGPRMPGGRAFAARQIRPGPVVSGPQRMALEPERPTWQRSPASLIAGPNLRNLGRDVIMGWKRYLQEETGQGLVELALGVTVLLMLVMGIADLGRAYFTYVALGNAAGEGASYGSFYPTCPYATSGPSCGDPDNVDYRTRHESQQGLIDTSKISSVTVELSDPQNPQAGDTITVTVQYDYEWITPFFRTFTGQSSIGLRARATQPVRSN